MTADSTVSMRNVQKMLVLTVRHVNMTDLLTDGDIVVIYVITVHF